MSTRRRTEGSEISWFTFVRAVITDALDGVSDHLLVVDGRPGRDFTAKEHQSSLAHRLWSNPEGRRRYSESNPPGTSAAILTTGHFGIRVLAQVSVQDGIADLVADLIWKIRWGHVDTGL